MTETLIDQFENHTPAGWWSEVSPGWEWEAGVNALRFRYETVEQNAKLTYNNPGPAFALEAMAWWCDAQLFHHTKLARIGYWGQGQDSYWVNFEWKGGQLQVYATRSNPSGGLVVESAPVYIDCATAEEWKTFRIEFDQVVRKVRFQMGLDSQEILLPEHLAYCPPSYVWIFGNYSDSAIGAGNPIPEKPTVLVRQIALGPLDLESGMSPEPDPEPQPERREWTIPHEIEAIRTLRDDHGRPVYAEIDLIHRDKQEPQTWRFPIRKQPQAGGA